MNQNKLNFCALLIRKYNLGNRDYFFREFSFAENEHLVESWNHALRNIKHRDIIKNAKKVDQHEVELIDRKIKEISSKKYQTIHYLYSKFDVKELKLTQENIERRVRHHLSTKLVEQLRKQLESKILVEKRQQRKKEKLNQRLVNLSVISIVGLFFFYPTIKTGLTPVKVLADKYYEKSSYEVRVGAECNDGWDSKATGRGACSHHGGVAYWKMETLYGKTYEECKLKAINDSWID